MLRAHASMQAKKLTYALTINQRENLLEGVEEYNAKLESVLLANDRVSSLASDTNPRSKKPRIPKSLLHFWRHANCIFGLLGEAWKCPCKSMHDAKLWLKWRGTATVDFQVMLQFCHGAHQCMRINLVNDEVVRSSRSQLSGSVRPPLRPASQQSGVPSTTSGTSNISYGLQSCTTVKQEASKVSWVLEPQQLHSPGTPLLKNLKVEGLCHTVKHAACHASKQSCYGVLTDHVDERQYTVSGSDAPSQVNGPNAILEDVLGGRCSVALTRVQRYSVAATVASSLLQLESSPWAQNWSAKDVHLPYDPVAGTIATLEYDKPFIQTRLDRTVNPGGDNFRALGTLLLELCFGKALDEHALWQQQAFASSNANPLLRHFVACEWLKDVEGEAGDQYANAVRFCLHQAPVVLNDEKWRLEFAQTVA